MGSGAGAFVQAEHSFPAQPPRQRHRVSGAGSSSTPTPPYPYSVLLHRFPDRPGDITNVVQLVTASGATYSAFNGQQLALGKHTVATIAALARSGSGTRTFDTRSEERRA